MLTRLASLVILLAGAVAPAQAADDFISIIQPAADAMYDAGKPPALIIAAVRGESVFIAGYGEIAPGSGVKPDARSLVRIASLSKLMSSDVMAAMAAEGRLTVMDTLAQYAPAGAVVPLMKDGDPITLLNLATHTSGLKREAVEPRWTWLAEQSGMTVPGMTASYSNVGFDLLADALAQAGGAPYPDLFAHYTSGPLGMADTTTAPNAEQCARLITGGQPERACEDQTIMAGGGGMYSTAADMVLWMRYQLGVTTPSGKMRRAIAQHVYVDRAALDEAWGLDHAGKAAGIGLAWILLNPKTGPGPSILEKTGNLGGFMSYIAIAPDQQVGVFAVMARPVKARAAARALVYGVNSLASVLAGGSHDAFAPTKSDDTAETTGR